MIYIINSPVLTSFGTFSYSKSSVQEVISLLSKNDFKSVIGHETTSVLLSKILGVELPFNRETILQQIDDKVVVFKPKLRLEYKEYTLDELNEIEFELGILTKIT